MRYFLELSYNGASFHGWQIQPNASSVQQTIENALATILRHPTPVVGAGRTDTGVNARKMMAHFDHDGPITEKDKFLNGLNRLCGKDIAIKNLWEVAGDAHARFDAESRTYKYFVNYTKSPFLAQFSFHSPCQLDITKMNEAAGILQDTSDFTSFAKLHSDARTNICKVTKAFWEPWTNEYKVPGIVFTITADRFLRNMVRAIVGTLVDVGRGKISLNQFEDIIQKKDRCCAGTSMPANALFLWDITYPEKIMKR